MLTQMIVAVLFVSALCGVGGFAAHALRALEHYTIPGAVGMGVRGMLTWGSTPIRLCAGSLYALFVIGAWITRMVVVAGDFRGDMNTTTILKAVEQVAFNQVNRKMVSDYVQKIGDMKSKYDSMRDSKKNSENLLNGEVEALVNVIEMLRAGHNPALAWAQYNTIVQQRVKRQNKQAKKAQKEEMYDNNGMNVIAPSQSVVPSQWYP